MFRMLLLLWCIQGLVIASDLGTRLAEVKVFQQAFLVERVIKVQETDDLLLSRITQAVFFDDAIFVLDRPQQAIYQLDPTGQVLRMLPRGNGPQEYRNPSTIKKIWGNQFAVGTVHEIHIYNHEGEHKLRLSAKDGYLIPRGTFDWQDQSTFYSVDWFGPNYLNEPYIAILDTTAINKAERLGAFFDRPTVEGEKLGVFSFRAFARVKDTFWTASPYEGRIKVYDLEGNFLENLELGSADILTPEIYKELAKKHGSGRELVQAMREYESVYQIIPLASLVMVRCSRIIAFYDLSGNLLATGIRANVGELIVPIGNDRLVTQVPNIPLEHRTRYYGAPRNQPLLKALKAVGFNEKEDDEAIYLQVSRLVGE